VIAVDISDGIETMATPTTTSRSQAAPQPFDRHAGVAETSSAVPIPVTSLGKATIRWTAVSSEEPISCAQRGGDPPTAGFAEGFRVLTRRR